MAGAVRSRQGVRAPVLKGGNNMIHSLSGGVIADVGYHTFAKVVFREPAYADRPYWYLCPFSQAEAGDEALAPAGRQGTLLRGTIVKVERNVSAQCSPVPMNRIGELAQWYPQPKKEETAE